MLANKIDWLKNRICEIEARSEEMIAARKNLNPIKETLDIILKYLGVGIVWILFSDYMLSLVIKDAEQLKDFQLYKGWLYVIVSGGVFYAIILKRIKLFSNAITHIYDETKLLTAYDQQLEEITTILERQHEVLAHQKTALENSDQRYQLTLEGSNDALWEWDLESNQYHSSILSKPQYHLSDQPLTNNVDDWIALLHPEDRDATQNALLNFISSANNLYENTYRVCSDTGETRWIHSRAVAFRDETGKAKKIAGSHTDITESVLMSDAMHQEKELLESILLRAPVMILMTDPKGSIVRFNPMAALITGYNEEEAIGRHVLDLLRPTEDLEQNAFLMKDILSGEKTEHSDVTIMCKSGRRADILWYSSLIRDQQGELKYLLSVGVDDTENRIMLDQLHEMAYHDSLTRLPNRSFFRLQVQQHLDDAVNQHKQIAIVYMDLVDFKHINDSVGVEAGDQLLQLFAEKLRGMFHEPDLVSRIGGDEFAVMLVSEDDTTAMAERMHQAAELLKFKWTCHEQEFFVSVTMGMAIYPTHGCDLNILEINADTALFHAKEHARGKCVLFKDEMRNKILNAIHMSSLLRTALEQNQFSLAYQPIIELSTMTVSGVEALIRLNDAEGRPVSPMSFIPFSEQHGYINSISEWVIKTAAKQKYDWGQLGFNALTMSINLSGKCLTHNLIVQTLDHYMKFYHIRPEEFDLEITETAIIEDMDKSLKILDQLKEIGFSIALDDFGSGYSSLTYLNKLPIDTVKIDREFISQITEETDELHLLSAIIDLSHRLGLRVLAEGVETESQLQYLLKQGCDLAQGYYFCRPLPAAEAERFIKSQNNLLEMTVFTENTQ